MFNIGTKVYITREYAKEWPFEKAIPNYNGIWEVIGLKLDNNYRNLKQGKKVITVHIDFLEEVNGR